MWKLFRHRPFARRREALDGVAFCDTCGEVCTPECRSAARMDRARAPMPAEASFPR
jgi:hypothetical protein